LQTGRVSVRLQRRTIVACLLVTLAVLGLVLVQLCVGDYPMSPRDVLSTLSGHGSPGEEFTIYTLRLPRVVTAALIGLALGASGAIFQSLTRNPLGSPDVMGFTMGASVGAVLVILVLHGGDAGVTGGAMVGGFVTSAAVYLLAYRKGVQGFRLILVGIGISAILESVVSYLLLRARLQDAQDAYVWLVGSLNGRDWGHVVIIGAVTGLMLPAGMVLSGRMRMLEMGDDTAQALGVPVEPSRRWLLGVGTMLCAGAVAAGGPISFVALAAPQIMRRLTGGPLAVLPSALMGAFLLVLSDLAGQRLWPDIQFPVGIATLCIGGIYLAWLLFRQNKTNRF